MKYKNLFIIVSNKLYQTAIFVNNILLKLLSIYVKTISGNFL